MMWRAAVVTIMMTAMTIEAVAQDRATCVSYMETDAVYEERVLEADAAVEESRSEFQRLMAKAFPPDELFLLNFLSGQERVIVLRDMLNGLPEHESESIMTALKRIKSIKDEIIRQADAERDAAYRAAYKGPTSEMDSVMNRLIDEDRRRCGL